MTSPATHLMRTPQWARYTGGTFLPGEDRGLRDEVCRETARWPRICQPVPPSPDLEIRPAGMPIGYARLQ